MTLPGDSAQTFRRTLRTVAHREPRTIALPRVQRRVAAATVPQDVVSLFIDGFVLLAACPFVLGFGAVLFRGSWPLVALISAFIYLAGTWATGQSPGMRFAHIRLVRPETGGPPGFARAAVRAALLLPVIVAVVLLADAILPQETRSFANRPMVVYASVGLVLFGALTHLWALVDPRSRALHDVLVGLATVHDVRAARIGRLT